MTYVLFLVGLVGLFFGGEGLVRGAVGLAERLRVPPLVIGLTIVGFGTSAPELLVSVQAALEGKGGIAIGNVVGSNIANILLILGIAAAMGPVAARFGDLRRDLMWMLGAAALTVPVFWDGAVSHLEGWALTAGILFYILICLRSGRSEPDPEDVVPPLWRSVATLLGGLVVLLIGARLLVDSASDIARAFGVTEAVIGLTVVAVGTSLPELATTVIAAVRGQRDIALGNVIGSNIFNVLSILGITAIIAPIPVEARFLALDVPIMIGLSAALAVLVWGAGRVPQAAGFAMLAAYAGYVAMTAGL